MLYTVRAYDDVRHYSIEVCSLERMIACANHIGFGLGSRAVLNAPAPKIPDINQPQLSRPLHHHTARIDRRGTFVASPQ
jgi:hypothetical protein